MLLLATSSGRLLAARAPRCAVSALAAAAHKIHTFPDPVSLQSIHEFLGDINYFQQPRKFVDVGLQRKLTPPKKKRLATSKLGPDASSTTHATPPETEVAEQLDNILELLSREIKVPELDFDDVLMEGESVIGLATTQGIYRDLFGSGGQVSSQSEDIHFTRAQAEKLDQLVPHYWITDMPFARVSRHPKEPEPVRFFRPLVRVAAKFIHAEPQDQDHLYAHTTYYGNHIPASQALKKPSITLDCHLLSQHEEGEEEEDSRRVREKDFDNWSPGSVRLVNQAADNQSNYYSLLLLNLDYLHPNTTDNHCNLHWMAANIKQATPNQPEEATYDELCDYLPVHGIRGFGYSRYVFLLLQHTEPITGDRIQSFSLEARKFNLNSFMETHRSKNIVPVGLSWFQTSWDHSSNAIFHDYVNIKAPVYDHVQTAEALRPQSAYPGKVPFNIYLDHLRSKQDINQQVLLERLKDVDPFDYKDQYEIPKLPPTIHPDHEQAPSWMRNVLFKKKNKIGYWRGLRPASATLPLNNNADLDYPLRPVTSIHKRPPEFHNQYRSNWRKKSFKEMPCSLPVSELTNVYVQEDHEIHLEATRKIMEEFKSKKTPIIEQATNKKTTKSTPSPSVK